MDLVQVIFHEKQEGALCGQHCLNSLLQKAYFTAVDLAEIGRGLDEQERSVIAESNDLAELEEFTKHGSGNVDDSGFFSVQVISKGNSWLNKL